MSALIPVILSLLQTLLSSLTASGTVGIIAKIVETLIQIVPIIVKEVRDLIPEVKNIISALKSTDGITPDQMTALETLDAQCDADFETAATNAITEQTIDDTHPNAHITDQASLAPDHPNAV